MVRFERAGGISGVLGVSAIAAQYALVGTVSPDAQAIASDPMRWELATLLRIVGGLGVIWFTSGLAARLRRLGTRPMGPATVVLGSGILWGWVWLLSGLFSSVAISTAISAWTGAAARWLSILGTESALVLTPTLAVAFLAATGVAVLASPTFPRRYGYMTLFSAALRLVLGLVDWYGAAEVALRIVDFTLLWVVVTSIHLLGATRPEQTVVVHSAGAISMHVEPGVWNRLGASAGIWACLWLAAGYAIAATATANPFVNETDFVRVMLSERMKWEWITLVRLVGGALVLWFMASLAGRMRTAEGEPGRMATTAFGLGVVWAGVWLLSAFFNSASILLADVYHDPAGSRIAAALARETPQVLTAAVVFALLLAVSFVVMRCDGFPKVYRVATVALTPVMLVLALADWYGPGTLGPAIVGLALSWMAVTSAMLVPGSRHASVAGV